MGTQDTRHPGVHVPYMGVQPRFPSLIVLSYSHLSDILSDSVRFCNNYSLFRSFRYQRNSPWRIRLGRRSVSTLNVFLGGPCWVSVAARGLSLVAENGAALYCGAQASPCDVFSMSRSTSPGCVGFRSYGTCAQWLWLVGSRARSQ